MNHRTATFILVLATLAIVAACCAVAHGQGRCYRLPDGRVVCEHPLTPERSPGFAWVRPVQPSQRATPAKYAAIVKISVDESAGMFSWATGTIIDRTESGAYVATVSHLFDEWKGGKIIVHVVGQRYAARLLGRDLAIDTAILKICDPGIKAVPATDVSSGESWAGGYPVGRALKWIKGRFVGYQEQSPSRGSGVFTRCAVFSGAVTPGESGGPVVQNGHLVAVIWGSEGGETYGTPFPIIRKVLGHLVPCWRRKANPPPVLPGPGPGPPPEPPDEPLVPLGPSPVTPTYPPLSPDPLDAINARLDKLAAAIAAIPAGAKGEQGIQGLPGAVGELSEGDLDALAKKVIAKLPPITFQPVNSKDEPITEAVSKHLGETLLMYPYLMDKPKVDKPE
jgi:hypothetical protein